MEKTRSEKNKKIKKTTSVNERLVKIRLESNNINKEALEQMFRPPEAEEYPRLRRPKLSTLFKIQKHQKKSENSMVDNGIDEGKIMEVPLRREFIHKREQMEQATIALLKKYEQHSIRDVFLNDDLTKTDADDGAKFAALKTKFDKQIIKETNKTNRNQTNLTKCFNYCEQHLINILETKVKAHPNGIFADNLPFWYKNTFVKDIPSNWLELLRTSNRFEIENVQNKTVLYFKQINEDRNIDLKASGDNAEECDSFVGFVRYKHLEKSLRNYMNKNLRNGNETPLNKM